MKNLDTAKKIKSLLVEMAINDTLPIDLSGLDETVFLPILEDQKPQKTFYLFGHDACYYYFNESFDVLLKKITSENLEHGIFLFIEGETKSAQLVDALDGWSESTAITEEEYNKIIDATKDLFDEDPESLPQELQDILNAFTEKDGDGYENCAELVKELNKIGYTCEYYLDAQPYNLRKL